MFRSIFSQKAIVAVLLVFLFACAGAEKRESLPEEVHPARIDCSKVPPKQYFDCMRDKDLIWEKRENAAPVETVLSEARDGNFVLRRVRICWADFCRIVMHREYDPEFKTVLYETSLWIALGFGVGAYAGASAGVVFPGVVFPGVGLLVPVIVKVLSLFL